MDGPGEHAKWNKPVRERQIPYDFYSYVESNEQTEPASKIETDLKVESRMTTTVRGEVRG